MESILEKIGLYDFFVRLLTGVTILVCAEFFGIIDWLHQYIEESTFNSVAIIIGGYFIGVVLEELTYFIGRNSEARKIIKNVSARNAENPELEEKKRKLISAGYENLIESPLIHSVISGSFAITFLLFSVLYIANLLGGYDIIPGNSCSSWINLVVLLILTFIFGFRYFHYGDRQNKLIERYYAAYCRNERRENADQPTEENN